LGDGGAEDKAPALGPHYEFDALASVRVGHELDSESQTCWVGQQRREVFEDDARLWMILNVSDQPTKLFQAKSPLTGSGKGGPWATILAEDRIACSSTRHRPKIKTRRMASKSTSKNALETIEPVGSRVLIRKDEDKKQTKSGIHLPDKVEIPTITGRVIAVAAQIENDDDYPVKKYDRVLFNPKNAIPVDLEGDNRLFVIPIEDVVAIFRRDAAE
jgi:chaperonin GroES